MPDFRASYITGFLSVLLLCLLAGCNSVQENDTEPVRPVKLVTVKKHPELVRVFPGTVRSSREAVLSFKVANQLITLDVDKGDFVHEGDVVSSLDPRDFDLAVRSLQGSLREARANLAAMRTGARVEDVIALESRLESARSALEESSQQYERHRTLFEQGAVAEADLDRVRTAFDEARSQVRGLEMELEKALTGARPEDIQAMEARIDSLEARLGEAESAREDAVLKAPFSGYITDKFVDNHENVAAGQPIVRLLDLAGLEVIFGLPEQVMVHRNRISEVYCILDAYPELTLPIRIREISPAASEVTFSYSATATILAIPDDLVVLPSMAAHVHIRYTDKDTSADEGVFLLPEAALFSRDKEKTLVWIFDPQTSRVNSREVWTGELTSQGVQVIEGIKPGEQVVAAGAQFLTEGQRVNPINRL